MIIHYTVEEKHFCCYCLQPFSREETLNCHVKDYFKINGKQMTLPFMIYVDFESILVPEDN